MVQGRWEHLNRSYSFLTKTQAIFLDGHFMLEKLHPLSERTPFSISTALREFFEEKRLKKQEAGNTTPWTEDLDLSYRAQMKGWKFCIPPHLSVPAELPVEINSFKSQQCRWAKGAMQTCKKVLVRVLKGDYDAGEKLETWYHLTGNITYPLDGYPVADFVPGTDRAFQSGLV